MICLACAEPAPGSVCDACALTFGPAPERHVGGVLVRSAFAHGGAARRLVHRLKYEGLVAAAAPLAAAMAPLVPGDAPGLVPVPRVVARKWRHGVDPAAELARALARLVGLPVVNGLRPAIWTARRAGPAGRHRGQPRFGELDAVDPMAVLVDDVMTTGTTLGAAAAVSGSTRAVTATAGVRP